MRQTVDQAEFPQLPSSCESVSEIAGPYSVACCRSRCEGPIARYLADRCVDFYNPRRKVSKEYAGHWKHWGSALFPGILIVGHGMDGREAVCKYGERHRDQVRGFIDIRMYDGCIGQKFLGELVRVETMLAADPFLDESEGLRRGRRVRVDRGPFRDLEGVIDDGSRAGVVYVSLPLLQRSIPVPIARDLLTLLD